jgi:hypothetical protein
MTNVFFERNFKGDLDQVLKKIIQNVGNFNQGYYFCVINYSNKTYDRKKCIQNNLIQFPVNLYFILWQFFLRSSESEYSDKTESITLLKATKSWDGTLCQLSDGQPEITVLKIAYHPTLHWIGINILLSMQLMLKKAKSRLKKRRW